MRRTALAPLFAFALAIGGAAQAQAPHDGAASALPRIDVVGGVAILSSQSGLVAGFVADAQERSAPPRHIGPIWDGRHHQLRRQEVEDRLRERGVLPGPERRQDQLRDLNALSRELLPPGSPLPAPEVARDAPVRR